MSSFKASSLYSGIFGDDQDPNAAPGTLPSTATAQQTSHDASASSDSAAALPATTVPSAAPAAEATPSSEQSKTPAWSAALRFAPRKSANAANRPKPRPNAALLASFAAPPPQDASAGLSPSPLASNIPNANPASTRVRSARDPQKPSAEHPSEASSSKSAAPSASAITAADVATTAIRLPSAKAGLEHELPDAAPVLVPPPMTLPQEILDKDRELARAAAQARGEHLGQHRGGPSYDDGYNDEANWEGEEDEDVNGFLASAAGKKASKKKKNKRKRGNTPPAGPNMNHDYDPRIPNDYVAYKELVTKRREAELAVQREQVAHRRDDDREDSENFAPGMGVRARGRRTDDWSDKEEEDRSEDERDSEERRRKLSRFAPPSTYGTATKVPLGSGEPEPPATGGFRPLTSASSTSPMGSGLPHSSAASAASSSSVYRPPTFVAPRGDTVAPLPESQPAAAPGPPPPRPPPASSGEEAYARRAAMSAAMTGEEAYQRRLAMSQAAGPTPHAIRPPPPPPPPSSSSSLPPSAIGSSVPQPLPPYPSGTASPTPPPGTAARQGGDTGVMDFSARQSAAAAIAARLAKVARPPSQSTGQPSNDQVKASEPDSTPSPTTSAAAANPHDFAARMMQKYGHKTGEGLGAEGNKGMLTPLLSTSTGKGRGTISDASHSAAQAAERARYGEVTNVVLLLNMVARAELTDARERQECLDDIREECSKFGYVKALVPSLRPDHLAKPDGRPGQTQEGSEDTRIFVEFTGEAGAFRAVKALDGRFFGGKTVRARFFDAERFGRGAYW